MGSLAEGEWCTWTNGRAGRNSSVAWRHDTVDGGLMIIAVEATALNIRAERTEVVSFFVVVVRWHGLVSHPTRCWRL